MTDLQFLSSRAIRGMYFAARESNTGARWLDGVSNLFGSDQASETYKFMGAVPAFQEWVGGRQANGFRGDGVTIINKHYENTIELRKTDLRRDKTAQIQARLAEFANSGDTHWASLMSTLIINGESTTCYDGQFFFDTDHSTGDSGTQSNDISCDISTYPTALHGSTTAPSIEEMQWAILDTINAITSFKDDRGQPMNEDASSFLVMVPTGLAMPARAAVSLLNTAPMPSNMSPNLFEGLNVSVVTNVRLSASWTTKFVTFRTDSPIKALIRQTEQEVELKMKAEGSEYEFDNDAWQFGLDGWRGAGYGYWQRACLATLT
jgi:phage major head subunit gpT-like protein